MLTGWLLAGLARAQTLQEGDLVFQTSTSRQSLAIRTVTGSPLTHVGVLLRRQGEWWVVEAHGPVQVTRYQQFLARGQGRRVLVKRWRGGLTAAQSEGMRRAGRSFLGQPYDPLFRWGDDRIYCSELVWKIYRRGAGIRLGEPQKFAQLDLSSPAARMLVRERGRPPASEPVVTPAGLAGCVGLTTVLSTYP